MNNDRGHNPVHTIRLKEEGENLIFEFERGLSEEEKLREIRNYVNERLEEFDVYCGVCGLLYQKNEDGSFKVHLHKEILDKINQKDGKKEGLRLEKG